MTYPEDFTAEDIMQFEYEYNRFIDLQDPYSLVSINTELQLVAEKQQLQDLELVDYYGA